MVTFKELRALALSLSEVTEEPHFEKTSFRIKGAIFATYEKETALACVKLSLDDQSLFSSANKKMIYPVANWWGTKGWTFVELTRIEKGHLSELLRAAYAEVNRKKKPRSTTNSIPKKSKQK